MVRWRKKRPEGLNDATDTLSLLLDREQRLASQLDAAKAEAERLVSEARAYAASVDATCDTLIEDRSSRLAATYGRQLQAELDGIETDAALEAKRFDDSDEARTRRLVAMVLEAIGAMEPRKAAR